MRPEHDVMRSLLRARMDRRRFLAASGATMGALAMGASRGAGVRAQGELGDTLVIASWGGYHDPATLDAFRDATGVVVDLRLYGSTEEQEALIRAGNSGIDIAVPSQYAVLGWTTDGLLEPLDYSRLSGVDLSTWDPLFIDQDFDPGNRYTIPKNWGTTGITYWADEVDPAPASWADFFSMAAEDRYFQRFQIVDHQISSLGSAAVAMGYGLNTVDETELNAIADMLIALKPNLAAINSFPEVPLRNRDTLATMAWTGNGLAVVQENPDIVKYIVASDGGELWVDSWGIAADAPHKDAAYAFLEFILQPEHSAADTVYSLFPHANPAVLPLLPPEVAGNQVIYPPAELLQTLTISNAEAYNSPLRSEIWATIKSS